MPITNELVFKDKNQMPDDVVLEKYLKNKFTFLRILLMKIILMNLFGNFIVRIVVGLFNVRLKIEI